MALTILGFRDARVVPGAREARPPVRLYTPVHGHLISRSRSRFSTTCTAWPPGLGTRDRQVRPRGRHAGDAEGVDEAACARAPRRPREAVRFGRADRTSPVPSASAPALAPRPLRRSSVLLVVCTRVRRWSWRWWCALSLPFAVLTRAACCGAAAGDNLALTTSASSSIMFSVGRPRSTRATSPARRAAPPPVLVRADTWPFGARFGGDDARLTSSSAEGSERKVELWRGRAPPPWRRRRLPARFVHAAKAPDDVRRRRRRHRHAPPRGQRRGRRRRRRLSSGGCIAGRDSVELRRRAHSASASSSSSSSSSCSPRTAACACARGSPPPTPPPRGRRRRSCCCGAWSPWLFHGRFRDNLARPAPRRLQARAAARSRPLERGDAAGRACRYAFAVVSFDPGTSGSYKLLRVGVVDAFRLLRRAAKKLTLGAQSDPFVAARPPRTSPPARNC